jgi:hypothetical protein
MTLDELLVAANARLKASKTGISIFKRGNKLSLRGNLPNKKNPQVRSQQTISLNLYSNAAGIGAAEKKAQSLASELAFNQFDWKNYGAVTEDISDRVLTIQEWCDRFEEDYFNRRARTPQSGSTWRNDYQTTFRLLPKDSPLTEAALLSAIWQTDPDSRTRKRAVITLTALARFAGLNVDFSRYKGNYSHLRGQRRLPSDREIVEQYYSISNPKWQFVYGLLAAYGISSHELFYLDLTSLQQPPGHLISPYRKNHYETRRIWAIYPEWWEDWQLFDPNKVLPPCSGKDNSTRSSKISRAFKTYGLCKPGDLRHCWAIRAMNFIPNAIAARMMAHSESEHNRTYQHWINRLRKTTFTRF